MITIKTITHLQCFDTLGLALATASGL